MGVYPDEELADQVRHYLISGDHGMKIEKRIINKIFKWLLQPRVGYDDVEFGDLERVQEIARRLYLIFESNEKRWKSAS